MHRRRKLIGLARLLLPLLITCVSAVAAERVWVVNAGSELPLVPASYADVRAVQNRPLAASRDGRMLPADTYRKRHYILMDEVRPFSAANVTVGEGDPLSPMSVEEKDEAVTVATENGTWVFGRDGRWLIRKSSIGIASRVQGRARVRYRGAAMVVLASADRNVEVRVFRTGILQISTAVAQEFVWGGREGAEASLAANLGYAVPLVGKCELSAPTDWCRYGGNLGLHVGYDDAKVEAGARSFKVGKSVFLAPVLGGAWASTRTQAALTRSIVLDSKLKGRYDGFLGTVYVDDRDADGVPDFDHDLWGFDLATDGKMELVMSCHEDGTDRDGDPDVMHVYRPRERGLSKLILGPPRTGLWNDAAPPSRVERSGEYTHRPILSLVDWNDDSTFLLGSLLWGGYVQQDRVVTPERRADAYDLDGDGDADIANRGTSAQFDFEDIFIGMIRVRFDLEDGIAELADFTAEDRYGMARVGVSLYERTDTGASPAPHSRSPLALGPASARPGTEECATVFVRRGQTGRLPAGASFCLRATGSGADRIAIGRLGSTDRRTWHVMLDPIEESPTTEKQQERIVRYRDVSGHEYAAVSTLFPSRWDGRELKWEQRQTYDGALSLYPHAPWQQISAGACFPICGVRAWIAHEAPAGNTADTSPLYDGRTEVNADGASFTLYYSSLVGGLHLKGADRGYSSAWSDGATDNAAPRLVYRDRDADGYFDTYALDMDADGVYERMLWYDAKAEFVELQDGGARAVWPHKAAVEDVPYEIGSYADLRRLYRRGYAEAPMVERSELASSGIPIERETVNNEDGLWTTRGRRPPFFFVFSDAWLPRAVVFQEDTRARWQSTPDRPVQGLVPLRKERLLDSMVLTGAAGTIDSRSLRDVRVLFVRRLSHVLSEAELACLLRWVEDGGVLVVSATGRDSLDRAYLNALGETLGFRIGDRLTLAPPLVAVTRADGATTMGRAAFGKGHVFVVDEDVLTRWHTDGPSAEARHSPQATAMIRAVRRLVGAAPRVAVQACSFDRGVARLQVTGPGGAVSFPRLWAGREVTIDERPVEAATNGALSTVLVPAGEHVIQVRRTK